MRVAVLSNMISPLAEPYAGGTEAITARLAAELAARGHSVTLFATEGSAVPGVELVTRGVPPGTLLWPASPDAMDGATMRDLLVKEQDVFHRIFLYLRDRQERFDVLHNHSFSGMPILLGAMLRVPLLTTIHVPPILLEQLAALRALSEHGTAALLTAVSHGIAREYASVAPVMTVIHNGVDVPPLADETPGEDLLFVGRISPEKGVDLAIAVARAAGRRLLVAGRIEDQGFFDREVAPHLDESHVVYAGHLRQSDVWTLMSRAHATLFTPRWPEPCSLAVLESMARCTPAIGFAAGGLPEQIVDGVTGFLTPRGDVHAAARAVQRVASLDRDACRRHVAQHFSVPAMVDAYERCYATVLHAAT